MFMVTNLCNFDLHIIVVAGHMIYYVLSEYDTGVCADNTVYSVILIHTLLLLLVTLHAILHVRIIVVAGHMICNSGVHIIVVAGHMICNSGVHIIVVAGHMI